MLRRIPLPTFYDWLEYAKCEPFGEQRADLRIGYGLAKLATLWTTSNVKPSDFMPFSEGSGARPKQTPAQMAMVLKGMAALHKQAKKAPDSAQTAAKGPRIDDRRSDGLIDPENA